MPQSLASSYHGPNAADTEGVNNFSCSHRMVDGQRSDVTCTLQNARHRHDYIIQHPQNLDHRILLCKGESHRFDSFFFATLVSCSKRLRFFIRGASIGSSSDPSRSRRPSLPRLRSSTLRFFPRWRSSS